MPMAPFHSIELQCSVYINFTPFINNRIIPSRFCECTIVYGWSIDFETHFPEFPPIPGCRVVSIYLTPVESLVPIDGRQMGGH